MKPLLLCLLLVGCSHTEPPAVTFVLDVYVTDEGFFVVTKRGSDDSMAIRFNANEILRTDEPIIIEP